MFFSEAETEATDEERLDQTGSVQTGSVQTVRAKNPMVQVATAEDKIGALAFAPPTTPATFTLASATSEPVSLGTKSEPVGRATMEGLHEAATSPEAKALSGLDEVERYLWEVYQRAPVKKDGSGDFTWKDPVAAKRFGKSMPAYVIGGMDPDFKEQLYHAGKAMDAAGVQWAILSAFRDDYRQSLASGFKASARNSLHGGSAGSVAMATAARSMSLAPTAIRSRSGNGSMRTAASTGFTVRCPATIRPTSNRVVTGASLPRRCGRAAPRLPRRARPSPRPKSPPRRRGDSPSGSIFRHSGSCSAGKITQPA